MNCHEFEEEVALSLARDSLLDAAAREQGMKHSKECERCAARLADERAILTRLRAVAEEIGREEPPARIEEVLLAAFRIQKTVISTPRPATRRSVDWLNWKLAAVAVGILLLISATVFWRSASSRKPLEVKQAMSTVGGAAPKSPKESMLNSKGDRMALERPKNEPNRARSRASVNRSHMNEMVTQFFPLMEGEDISKQDGLRLVRVELPGSALGELGLPVDPETARTRVKADVMLGQDGLARAIRFVR